MKEWIDVNDRLPDIDTLVLAWVAEKIGRYSYVSKTTEFFPGENGYVLARYNKFEKWEWQAFGNYCTEFTKTEISHWMPLPERVDGRET